MITHEETMEELKKIYNGMYNNLGYIKEFKNIEQALAELEELKKDVARFMVLLNIYLTDTQTIEEMHERWALEKKLSKVGKE